MRISTYVIKAAYISNKEEQFHKLRKSQEYSNIENLRLIKFIERLIEFRRKFNFVKSFTFCPNNILKITNLTSDYQLLQRSNRRLDC